MYAIECSNLTKTYQRGAPPAVDRLSLRIEPQQVFGFLGRNGAGKTTTIRLLLDLIRPTEGEVRLFGEPVRGNPKARQTTGAMVEGASFYPYLSAWDNLRVYQWTSGEFDTHRADRLLEIIGLKAYANQKVSTFSTGMKQRLGIAATLLHDPQLIILDEPTNGLDPAGIKGMRQFIRSLVDEQGKTVFLSSHLLGEVQSICDRVAIIQSGKLIQEGRVEEMVGAVGSHQLRLEATPIEKVREILLTELWQIQETDHPNQLIISQVGHDDIPKLAQLLVNAGVLIYRLDPLQLTLEDYFFSITEGS